MSKSSYPFMSVVVCSYNGAATLAAVLESLARQTYPKNRYEIILIDDGSKDATPSIANRYPEIIYVRNESNQGIAAARNIGLEVCRGDIYVGFDDDCIAEPDWLENLAVVYKEKNIAGVGGTLVMPDTNLNLTSRYLSMCDFYVGLRQEYADKTYLKPWLRLLRYLKSGLLAAQPKSGLVSVDELYGANSSFPRHILESVGGWRVAMSGIEDRDLCHRIHVRFPDLRFFQTSSAKLMHSGGHQAGLYFRRPLKRGIMNLRFYKNVGQLPPIFPFPLVVFIGALSAAQLSWILSGLLIVILPLILYFWWPVRAFRHRQLIPLIFAYFQFLEETMVMAGLIRGYISLMTKPKEILAHES